MELGEDKDVIFGGTGHGEVPTELGEEVAVSLVVANSVRSINVDTILV